MEGRGVGFTGGGGGRREGCGDGGEPTAAPTGGGGGGRRGEEDSRCGDRRRHHDGDLAMTVTVGLAFGYLILFRGRTKRSGLGGDEASVDTGGGAQLAGASRQVQG